MGKRGPGHHLIFRPNWGLQRREVLISWGQRPLLPYVLNERTPHLLTCLFLLCKVYLTRKTVSSITVYIPHKFGVKSWEGTIWAHSPVILHHVPALELKITPIYSFMGIKDDQVWSWLTAQQLAPANIRDPFLRRHRGQNAELAIQCCRFRWSLWPTAGFVYRHTPA